VRQVLEERHFSGEPRQGSAIAGTSSGGTKKVTIYSRSSRLWARFPRTGRAASKASTNTIPNLYALRRQRDARGPERHRCELYLDLNGIEHRRTRIRTPRINGFVERFNGAVLDEFFRVKDVKPSTRSSMPCSSISTGVVAELLPEA
jgi:transposase InsO family protein